MPIYMTLKSIPELSDLPAAERLRLWRRCCFKVFRHRQAWAAAIAVGLCIAAAVIIGGLIGAGFEVERLGIMTGAIVGGLLFGFAFGQILIALVRPYLRAERQADEEASGDIV